MGVQLAACNVKVCRTQKDFEAQKLNAKPINYILVKPLSKKVPSTLHWENLA